MVCSHLPIRRVIVAFEPTLMGPSSRGRALTTASCHSVKRDRSRARIEYTTREGKIVRYEAKLLEE